jgi:hypothetical protein
MALRTPFELTPPEGPSWRSGITPAQVGPMAEDLLGVAFAAAAGGLGTVAWPMVDRGIDLYLRRRRSLLTIPTQVKAFRQLTPDGAGTLDLPVDEVSDHPNAHIAMVHLPPPHDQLYRRLFLIPFTDFSRRCRREQSHGKDVFHFEANFAGASRDDWSDFLLEIKRLPEWLDAIPGWTTPVPAAPSLAKEMLAEDDGGRSQWQGDLGRLWAAAQIERAAGPGAIVIAEDRVRLDTVTLLIHDLQGQEIAGLHIRTTKITPARTVHFEIKRPTFFIDEKLYVLFVLLGPDEQVHDFCLLMPSKEIPRLGYSETITLRRLTKRFVEYRVPSEQVGSLFLKKAFGS